MNAQDKTSLSVDQALVELALDLLAVHILSDEDKLLHAVTVFRIPHLTDLRILLKHALDGSSVSRSKEASALHFLDQAACLFKNVRHIRLFPIPDHALAADDRSRPLLRKIDELCTVKRAAAEIDERSDAVLLDLIGGIGIVVMMVMVVMMSMTVMLLMLIVVIVSVSF